MKARTSFASFDYHLRRDLAAAKADERERLGIEQEKRKRGRPKLTDEPVVMANRDQWNVLKLPDELAAQVERIADEVGVNRTGFARLVLAAGIDAVLNQLEGEGRVSLPLTLKVEDVKRGTFRDFLRVVTPERFRALCSRHPWPLRKWLPLHPGDRTGTPMPPS